MASGDATTGSGAAPRALIARQQAALVERDKPAVVAPLVEQAPAPPAPPDVDPALVAADPLLAELLEDDPPGIAMRPGEQPPEFPDGSPLRRPIARAVCHLMAWEGLTVEQVASRLGKRRRFVRALIADPQVAAYYRAECERVRDLQRGRNIAVAASIRDRLSAEGEELSPAGAKVALEAAKYLDKPPEGGGPAGGVNVNIHVGYVMDLTGDKAGPQRIASPLTIDANVLKDNDKGGD